MSRIRITRACITVPDNPANAALFTVDAALATGIRTSASVAIRSGVARKRCHLDLTPQTAAGGAHRLLIGSAIRYRPSQLRQLATADMSE